MELYLDAIHESLPATVAQLTRKTALSHAEVCAALHFLRSRGFVDEIRLDDASLWYAL